ncbi:hypothetical protein CYLTODRAFT_89994 [Cylindrobasidium torrendii FP15055 ss-10]|uniref:Prokaryotic-type class I peptide chain release factors domain-containing protein n=1 Tax=Cylindrobasidium torrendii FP15055 ss-10 TaxID=1314674 RepID=A0A0D7B4V8_9AGAR|nr:hypothetical protein CYLTODRAFT_89994 [Cylindrobasidium torrendii FP15055 ss-10]
MLDQMRSSFLLTLRQPTLLRSSLAWNHGQQARFFASRAHTLPIPPDLHSLDSSEANARAREWVDAFRKDHIPKSVVELSFSRSSGPGGQNVNKVNTKATLRVDVNADWIPSWAKPNIKKSRFYVSSSQSIMVTSATSRSQAQNIDECLRKLHEFVLETASSGLNNETSPETRKRVEGHIRAAKERRKKEKMHQSAIQRQRSGKDMDYWRWD